MSAQAAVDFETYLNQHDEHAWSNAIAELLPSIHEVDRTATQIWFAFFPLALARVLQEAADQAQLAQALLLQGKYYLKDQIDSSHDFLYGHRSWSQAKQVVAERAESGAPARDSTLADLIREVAGRVATAHRIEPSLVIGITAVALMTLQQVGLIAFRAGPGTIHIDAKHARRSPAQVLKGRARDDSQGILGFLKTNNKEWTVTFNENEEGAHFKMLHMQEIASGAATDRRDWSVRDERCHEGPIPVQCRSASCGTCWVGVLGGAEKLTAVDRREGSKIKEFGYIDSTEPKPIIRLSCQAQGLGAVSIVIPPWNGVFGKYLRRQKELSNQLPEE